MEADTWYENAVVYAIDVEVFNDSDGDGVGDLPGLIEKLDHLERLGVSAVWLLPFYPTPNRDNGYDVMDYYGVDPRLGTLGDFVEFVDEAEARDIRVLVDLVANHTSDQHPWFQRARTDPDSKYRDYYVWAEEPPPPDPERGSVFPGEVEDERIWTYDYEAGAYYYHRFYPFQPDLNLQNPEVRAEIHRIVKFWLDLGVAGFRVDAATLMIQPKHPDAASPDDPHAMLRNLKRTVVERRSDGILLAEADDEPDELATYFGEKGDEMDLLMNFVLNAHLVAALATGRAAPLAEGLDRLPAATSCHWANFLRNYDELNIGRLPRDLQAAVFDRFAPDEDMRIYGRGIRRRLAPMLDDPQRYRLGFSLLFSLPGTPIVLYGDEIGMGDDQSLPGRRPIRTPMQWDDTLNAGFSDAYTDELVAPVIDEGPFGYEHVNVATQRDDPESLLRWMERLVEARTQTPAIGHGTLSVLDVSEASAFAHQVRGREGTAGFVHNLADDDRLVSVVFEGDAPASVDRIFGDAGLELRDDGSCECELDPYGFGWFEIGVGDEPGSGTGSESASGTESESASGTGSDS